MSFFICKKLVFRTVTSYEFDVSTTFASQLLSGMLAAPVTDVDEDELFPLPAAKGLLSAMTAS